MAARLSVVIMQSPKSQHERQQVEERLLIELMGTRGLEPVLVRSADQLAADQTDLLPLLATQADFVVCAWADAEATRASLERLGVSLRQPGTDRDRIHVFDLRGIESVEALVSHCSQMHQASQAAVVQIGISGSARPASVPPPGKREAAPRSAEKSRPQKPATAERPSEKRNQRDAELERLVDQLNDEVV